ncbi:MAG: hypothetical protein ACRCTM_04270 [Sphaerotilus sulfidivorans]|uniref:hypothetical protein n=1 Tax=Sphaerotilus sulfidivorans TaxID=639200 RepID=UPI003F3EFFA2
MSMNEMMPVQGRNEAVRTMLGTLHKKMNLSNVDITVHADHRPLCGYDIDHMRAMTRLDCREMSVAMAMLPSRYGATIRSSAVLSIEQEILLRLYMMKRMPISWYRHSAAEVFDQLYGGMLEDFPVGHQRNGARVMLFNRFGRLMGKSRSRAYIWITSNQGFGKTTEMIFGKIHDMQLTREEIESLVDGIYRLRGHSLDSEAPLPTPEVVGANRPGRRAKTCRSFANGLSF